MTAVTLRRTQLQFVSASHRGRPTGRHQGTCLQRRWKGIGSVAVFLNRYDILMRRPGRLPRVRNPNRLIIRKSPRLRNRFQRLRYSVERKDSNAQSLDLLLLLLILGANCTVSRSLGRARIVIEDDVHKMATQHVPFERIPASALARRIVSCTLSLQSSSGPGEHASRCAEKLCNELYLQQGVTVIHAMLRWAATTYCIADGRSRSAVSK
jgi:hypothetical protein